MTCRKVRSNRKMNFILKGISLSPIGVYAGIFIQKYVIDNQDFSGVILVYVVAAILSSILIQWIEVKKYQETWIRHAKHKFVLDNEMFKFISSIGEYERIDKKKYFRDKIRSTWAENNSLFLNNMAKEKKIQKLSKSISESKQILSDTFWENNS